MISSDFKGWCERNGGKIRGEEFRCHFNNGHVKFDDDEIYVLKRDKYQHQDQLWEGEDPQLVRRGDMIRARGGEETERWEHSEFGVEAEDGKLHVGYL